MRQHRVRTSATQPRSLSGAGFLFAVLLLTLAPTASGQYMYLDLNGDGINTAADQLSVGGPNRLTVYLNTGHDRDGSPVSCNSHTGEPFSVANLDILSYTVTLEVGNGPGNTVTFGAWADSLKFPDIFSEQRTSTAFVVSRFALPGFALPPGLLKLGAIDVTAASGAPSIRVSIGVGAFLDPFTGFGTRCDGSVYANTYVLGIDWFDTDGVGAPSAVTVPYPARVYVAGGSRTFRVHSGSPTFCVEIEPVEGSYDNADVLLSTITLTSEGTGSVGQVAAISDKTAVVGDKDRNGVEEIRSCFARAALENLFGGVSGRQTIPVTVEGILSSGRIFRGTVDLDVVGGGGRLNASVSPNPLNPEATLRFTTEIPGPLRVRVFDVGGRLVRELLNESSAAAGEHAIRIDGRGQNGSALASGVYLYRVDSREESTAGRFTILR